MPDTLGARSAEAKRFDLPNFDELPDIALVRLPAARSLVGLGGSAIYKMMAEGRFPKSVKITGYAVAWRMGDLRAWLANPTGWRPADAA